MKKRTRLEYGGESLPVMGCNFTAQIHPPAPPFAGPEYDAWKKKQGESPEMLITLEIAFPRYYWRAQYIQQGNQPLFIVDCPAIGNVVELKDCVFQNNVDLRLPNGTVIRGFPRDDMTAEAIRKNTAILEQEGLAANGSAELLAHIARMNAEIERIHKEHFIALAGIKSAITELHRDHAQHAETLGRVELQGADLVEEARRLKQGKRDAERKPMEAAMQAVNLIGDRLCAKSKVLLFAMKNANGNQTYAAKELGTVPNAVNKKLPKLRAEIREAGFELPEFMLPPKDRKREPETKHKVIHKAGSFDVVDERTPADEAMEREEEEMAEKDERESGPE